MGFQSHLTGIEMKQRREIDRQAEKFQSHLTGIEIHEAITDILHYPVPIAPYWN